MGDHTRPRSAFDEELHIDRYADPQYDLSKGARSKVRRLVP
jgi:hypothetical protein